MAANNQIRPQAAVKRGPFRAWMAQGKTPPGQKRAADRPLSGRGVLAGSPGGGPHFAPKYRWDGGRLDGR